MISFLENLKETVEKLPDRKAVVDHDGKRTTTYKELFIAAQKVNAYLRKSNIGREDVCAIYFDKEMEYIATRIGIMMSGAAFVGLENLMGKERIEYVIKDSKCKLVLDREKWDAAMKLNPCEIIADSDEHDLAFIIYTSGSTGNPKGAAQEYGVYENMVKGTYAFFGDYACPEPMHFAEVAPQTFVSGVYTTVGIFNVRGTIYEVSAGMIRDMNALYQYFIDNNIHHTFMTPTFAKLLLKNEKINLRAISIGGEVAADVYTDRFDIINIYGPSEFGFPTCTFKLDKAYDNTPIGYPTCETDIVLIDDSGRKSDEGKLCIKLPFFRGYVGEIKSDFVIVDEEKYFSTADYCKREADGRYVVLGRIDDMVKINGNRVDIHEVEAAVKKAFAVQECVVKLFMLNGIKALCAYYTGDLTIDNEKAAEALRQFVPEYMMPAIYLKLDEMPLNANGKVDKKSLTPPKGVIRARAYAEPGNDFQKELCETIQKVLELDDKVGIDDYIFLLGLDSIRVMEILSNVKISGLTIQMVYEGMTVRNISDLYEKINVKNELKSENTDVATLNVGQQYLINYSCKHPQTCMLNLPFVFNMLPEVDMHKLAKAINDAVRVHRALLCKIDKGDDVDILRYSGMEKDIVTVEEMSEDELEKAISSFVRPFDIYKDSLFRCRVIKSIAKKVVLLDVCHAICDGYSLKRFVDDVILIMQGKPLMIDNTLELMNEEKNYRLTEEFKRNMEYFADKYDHTGWSTYPKFDMDLEENIDDKVFLPFDIKPSEVEKLNKEYGLGKGGLFTVAAALSIAAYNKCEDIMLTWTWHGRSDDRRMASVGYFSKDLPVAFKLKNELQLKQLYEDFEEQIRNGISHGTVSYWEEKGSYEGKDLVCVLYQGELYEFCNGTTFISEMKELERPTFACDNILDIEILDGSENFGVLFDYNAGKYKRESIKRFGRIFCNILNQLAIQKDGIATIESIISESLKGNN